MLMKHENYPPALLELVTVANGAVRAVPPLFPLAASVAVNPFLGQSGSSLAATAARLARVSGSRIMPERAAWASRIDSGEIRTSDLCAALAAQPDASSPATLDEVRAALKAPSPTPAAQPTVAELAAEVSGIDWPGLVDERIGVWAASHFDDGQALWQPSRAGGAFAAWQAFAARDLTPEIHGLTGFGAFVAALPRSPWRAMGRASETLGLTTDAADTAFHRLLVTLGGWAQYARYLLWQAELAGDNDTTAVQLLTIRLVFEEALFTMYRDRIAGAWATVVKVHATPVTPTRDQVIDAVLQAAAERAAQRALAEKLAATTAQSAGTGRPAVQAAFCIDVRSEVFRRALESQDAGIQTLGFAGFFGLATRHAPAGSDVTEARGPALLAPGMSSRAVEPVTADQRRRYGARARRAWGRFKLAAVSSFAFVEAAGPIYVGKLLHDALSVRPATGLAEPCPTPDRALDVAARAAIAAKVLRAMSLTGNFARIVVLAGHGATVTNNPHESGLHCGACGGHAGDVNARLLAGLLNDTAVRDALRCDGIDIPRDTLFLAALHDTTTDAVTLFDADHPVATMAGEIDRLRAWLKAAGGLARSERIARLPRAAADADVFRRAADWSETRPEWGLAGCRAFIAAPRARTQGVALAGQVFLHDYDWRTDQGFGVLDLIVTAPVVVASWISLQYYGSSVAPQLFGAGNKLLHNVVGGIGVLEGNGGAPRPGLPWQSVHDGERLQHDPLRLAVVIEAPRDALTDILHRHPQVRALFDNAWMHLIAMDDDGRLAWRYERGLTWRAMHA
ncbi:YbcC family protein [Oceaniglobus indicus]|uniref:YbcC family protein n=1 Tax=Oceaniglobus indicus TaxID=2047749 RepID=UPI000C199DCB|nr:DUF2309 domain-containing protein [Oceaniglobus indicus]